MRNAHLDSCRRVFSLLELILFSLWPWQNLGKFHFYLARPIRTSTVKAVISTSYIKNTFLCHVCSNIFFVQVSYITMVQICSKDQSPSLPQKTLHLMSLKPHVLHPPHPMNPSTYIVFTGMERDYTMRMIQMKYKTATKPF